MEEVLRLWQGLGYYSRARNLHRCAQVVVKDYNGEFPDTYQELLKLPGVGKYTAAAIASFAFKEPVAVVDGNVYRVLSRVFGVYDDIQTNRSQKNFQELANALIDEKKPDEHNQAMMELGAVQCTPQNPDCMYCPLQSNCYAFENGVQNELPVKLKRVKIRKRYFHYAVLISDEGHIWMRPRTEKGIWQELFEFLLIEDESFLGEDELLERVAQSVPDGQLVLAETSEPVKHILTHQHLHVKFFHVHLKGGRSSLDKLNFSQFSLKEIDQLGKPILLANYLRENFF